MGLRAPAQLDIQERDLALLRGLFESRLMTLAHATKLHFENRSEATKKRVQKLKTAGLIGERPRRVYHPSILFLTRQGFETLAERGELSSYPALDWSALEKRVRVSDLTLRHELQVMDVKTALSHALAQMGGHKIVEFSTWPRLFQFQAQYTDPRKGRRLVLVKPDGFLQIQETTDDGESTLRFFLEVDRSTETQETLGSRALCYRDYFTSGGLAVRFGESASAFKDFPFRVLMMFANAERRNNTTERLLQLSPPIMQQVWLSTVPEVLADPLGPIWIRPRDYFTLTEGTAFDPERRRGSDYRRQPEREELVEETITKLPLLS